METVGVCRFMPSAREEGDITHAVPASVMMAMAVIIVIVNVY